jgi:hypothetical protein
LTQAVLKAGDLPNSVLEGGIERSILFLYDLLQPHDFILQGMLK